MEQSTLTRRDLLCIAFAILLVIRSRVVCDVIARWSVGTDGVVDELVLSSVELAGDWVSPCSTRGAARTSSIAEAILVTAYLVETGVSVAECSAAIRDVGRLVTRESAKIRK
jgi:hypothetical protein